MNNIAQFYSKSEMETRKKISEDAQPLLTAAAIYNQALRDHQKAEQENDARLAMALATALATDARGFVDKGMRLKNQLTDAERRVGHAVAQHLQEIRMSLVTADTDKSLEHWEFVRKVQAIYERACGTF